MIGIARIFALLLLLGAWLNAAPIRAGEVLRTQPRYAKEIAPILFQNCVPCHRPGQPAPFSLLNYVDAKKHGGEIVKATQRRYMPPWLPEPGQLLFADERRLTQEQIETLQTWFDSGMPEGNPADLPQLPKFADGWHLGEPDLVVTLPQAYALSAEGGDLYRNFVIPSPVGQMAFVRALEFHPNSKSVHHVRILLDSTRQSRRLDSEDADPGFPGMSVPARFPQGHMLTWTPGRTPAPEPDGLSWVLDAGADLVLQIHMQRSGKPERIQPALGLYFTNKPPAKAAHCIGLLSQTIEIPAGESNYVVERSFELPVDVEALSVLPHLHYLGKRAEAFALLPGGSRQSLLLIKEWDFNWQSQYRFAEPVALPKGSVISMRYTFDNSDANVRNPSHPPRPVVFGPQSADEMAELWLQVLPRRPSDLAALQSAYRTYNFRETAGYYELQLRRNPGDARLHFGLGKVLGPLGQMEAALAHFQTAARIDPQFGEARYYLGLSLYGLQRWAEAKAEFAAAVRLNPRDFKAHDGLGLVGLKQGNHAEARRHFQTALEINPDDPAARSNLQSLDRSPSP